MIYSIEQKNTYTEWSKYNKMNFKELEKVFKQRHLDWNYYFEKAKRETFSCHLGTVTPIDILTEDLKFYDDHIRKITTG